jgi:hypothetical protein
LSSTVDLQGELTKAEAGSGMLETRRVFRAELQALFGSCGVESLKLRRRKFGKHGAAGIETLEPVESCGIATAASFELRERFEAPWKTTY